MILMYGAVLLLIWSLLGWWVQHRTANGGYADVVWAYGVGAVSLLYLWAGEGVWLVRLVAAVLLGFWSWRLGSYILMRVLGEAEEGRYRAMREALGQRIGLFHFFFFLGQGLLAWLFALPAFVISGHDGPVQPVWLLLGGLVGVVALIGESTADRQLAQFRDDPANHGKTCREGLWRYSRHPNYFFEWLHWFSYPLLAVGAPGAMWLWLAPLLMWLFLWFVTGIPYTERQALKSRGEDYRRYQRTTSAFFPWRPRHDG